jgi:hypothetical protein
MVTERMKQAARAECRQLARCRNYHSERDDQNERFLRIGE